MKKVRASWQRWWRQCLHNFRVDKIELSETIEFTPIATLPALLSQSFGEGVHEFVSVGSSVGAIELILLDLPPDEPISQGKTDIDGICGKLLSFMADMYNRSDQ